MQSETNEVLDYRSLSAYLKIPEGSLRHMVLREGIPYYKIGRSVRFSKSQVDQWLEEHQRKNGVGFGGGLSASGGD
jgi:excisionase family DNA binding protein